MNGTNDAWNTRCFPTINEDLAIRRFTGFWSLFNFVAGTIGNLLTLVAIPYATRKRRYNFQNTFWKTDIWILHLAFCDLVFCLFCAPHYFIPYLGFRYPQGPGSDYMCTLSFIITILTFTNDWLLVAIVSLTRVFIVKAPEKWGSFCNNKIYVFLAMTSTWIFQILVMLPIFVQPSIEIGYNCLMGKCNYVPTGDFQDIMFLRYSNRGFCSIWVVISKTIIFTGREKIEAISFVGQPVFVGLPYLVAFLTPCLITMISYLIIWQAMRTNKRNLNGILTRLDKTKADQKLKDNEIKFIWTVFIICLCYLLCALPGIVLVDIFGMKDGTTFMLSLCLLWIQFSLNNFIYAYRSEKYRWAYRDLILLICPFLKK